MSTAVSLGMIAVGVVVMALIQVGAVVGLVLAGRRAARLAGRAELLMDRVERDLQPMIERLTSMSSEAARAASLAASQVERVDRMLADVGERLEHSSQAVQRALKRPAREGAALVAGLRAGVLTLREIRQRRRHAGRGDGDDDALFIG